MIRAFFSTSSGLVAQAAKQDTIANNIANANTPGFKRERAVSASFTQAYENQLAKLQFRERPPYPASLEKTIMVRTEQMADPTEGAIRPTGSMFDMAIDGPGEFEVSSPGGATSLTRNGSFRASAKGELVTSDGANVMGQSGAIRLPEGEEWTVTSDGSILAKGAIVDKIKIVGAEAGKTGILQGSLEDSNVNIVREMVDMIANMRSYEANQRMISNIDQSLAKLINEGGKV